MLIILIGIWVACAPQIGPAVDFGYSPDETWALTTGQLVLQMLPAVLAVSSGIVLIFATRRRAGAFAGGLATAAGAWLIVGPIATASVDNGEFVGDPLGTDGTEATAGRAVLEQLALYSGVGVLLMVIATSAATRFLVHEVRDAHDAHRERHLRDLRRQHRQDLRALRKGERSDRETHRRYVAAGVEVLHGSHAATQTSDITMPHNVIDADTDPERSPSPGPGVPGAF